jgi:hypothetical protein
LLIHSIQVTLVTQSLNTDMWETYLEEPGLMGDLEVQYEKNGKNKSCNDPSNDPLVPVHPLRHSRQDLFALPNVIVNSMQLQARGQQ